MKLFSWFIKTDKRSKTQQECLETSVIKPLESPMEDKLNLFNNNTMWPIAKVKTTTVMIKKSVKKEHKLPNDEGTKSNRTIVNLSLSTNPLAQD
ncbi:MAG: hypothetical protein QMC62_04310 [Alteromonadaceae bacterium]|jgi:hypothetical protein